MSVTGGCLNVARTVAPQKVFSHTKSMVQPGVYDEPLPSTKGSRGTVHPPLGADVNKGQQIPQPFMQQPPLPDLEAIWEAVHKPCLEIIDSESPYPMGYIIPDFSLFSREDGQSNLEHVAKFTV